MGPTLEVGITDQMVASPLAGDREDYKKAELSSGCAARMIASLDLS